MVLPRYQNLRQIGLIAIQINKCRLLISLYYNYDYNRGVRRGALGARVPPGGARMGGLIYELILYYVGKNTKLTLKGKSFSSFFNIFQTLENNFSSFLILFTQTFCNYNPKIFLIFRTNKPNPYFLET